MWGELLDLPYPLALEREAQHVAEAESRAIELMRSLCDEERFNYYIWTGLIFARGNITGTTYRIEHGKGHGAGIYELDDGLDVAYWCTIPGDEVPPTDHVLAMKNMIEGEEIAFRAIGNRSDCRGRYRSHWVEGTFRNFAAVISKPDCEVSICGEEHPPKTTLDPRKLEIPEIDQRSRECDIVLYRDCFFEPLGAMADRFGLQHVNDSILDERRPEMHICHTNDLYPYEGENPELERRIQHINNQMRAGTYPIDPMIPLRDGELMGPAGEVDCNNPDDALDNEDALNYPGPRAADRGAMLRFNAAIGGEARARELILNDGFLAEDGDVAYHQGFADGMRTARPHIGVTRRVTPQNQPNVHAFEEGFAAGARYEENRERSLFEIADELQRRLTPEQAALVQQCFAAMQGIGHGPVRIANYAPLTFTNVTATTLPYAYTNTYEFKAAHDEPGARTETDFARLAYADEIIRMKMTEPQESYEDVKRRQAMEIEL